MYPQVNKEQMPSAPPSYSDSQYAAQSYPPPQPGFKEPNPQVIIVQVPSTIPPLGPHPVQLTCPTCKALVMTSIQEDASNSAYLCCMFMFVVGCCLFSCLPFCMDSFKVFKHSCPRCNAFIGSYQS